MDKRWVATEFNAGVDALEFQDVEVPPPGPGEVSILVKAAGVNPVDAKMLERLSDPALLPFPTGFEIAGVVTALGQDALPTHGGIEIGSEVVAFRISGGYATRVNVPAKDVFVKPDSISFDEAAGLLLVGSTAAEMLARTGVEPGNTVLLHGASGALGMSVLQQAANLGARVIGTTSDAHAGNVTRFGGIPVRYGEGLADRVRDLAVDGIDVALDAAGTDEAIRVSLELVSDYDRILTVVRRDLADELGIQYIGGGLPQSAEFRDEVRSRLLALAGAGELVSPIARTFPLERGREALELVANGKSGGKVVLLP